MKKIYLISVLLGVMAASGCMSFGNSPAAVFRAFAAAAQKKDSATMKQYLSESSLAVIKSGAGLLNKTEDEYLETIGATVTETPDIQNEKIADDGKSATLDVKLKSGNLQTISFTNANGWKIDLTEGRNRQAGNNKKTSETESDESLPDSSSSSTSTTDTGPLSATVTQLLAKAGSSSSDDKLAGRMITVTGGELWEIQSGQIKVGEKYSTSNYVMCRGSFSEYSAYSSKVDDMRKAGKALNATIKGEYSSVSTGYSNNYVVLDPCVLSDLEK